MYNTASLVTTSCSACMPATIANVIAKSDSIMGMDRQLEFKLIYVIVS